MSETTKESKERIVNDELKKVDASFSKIEGFLEAAINEMYPPHTVCGPIESMVIYSKLDEPSITKHLVSDFLSESRSDIKNIISSLKSMKCDIREEYTKEFSDGKNTD